MKNHKSTLLAPVLLSLVAAAALVACGGGGSTSATPPATTPPAATVTPVTDAVTTASSQTATTIGASVIAGASSDEEVYNLAADVGDSWQLVLNNKTNTYVIKVTLSQFNLRDSAPAAFIKTTVGSITTIKDASGGALSVQIDNRTKTVAGNVTLGSKISSVSGSGYQIADVGKLAGNYFFAGSVRNASNGQYRDTPLGGFIVAANGTDITVCDGSIPTNGVCTAVVAGSPVVTKSLKISKDGGLLRIKDGARDFGILHVSAGDRGPVLIIDRFGLNEEAVSRTGVFYGAKFAKLAGTEFDGNWTCSSRGFEQAKLVVNGNSYTVTDNQKAPQQGTLQYNKAVSSKGVVDVNGVMIAQNNNEGLSNAALVLPLSSSLAVVVESPTANSTQFGEVKNITICRKV